MSAPAIAAVASQIPATWDKFRALTGSPDIKLLRQLERFQNPILVTGCQRSGTTMLTQILIESSGMVDYRFGPDNELDGALILAGLVDYRSVGRHCFQTTYVNEKYREYFEHAGRFKMVWVLRNPASVVLSMLNNWGGQTPNRLFDACGIQSISGLDRLRYRLFGLRGVSPLRRACWGYNGKTLQLLELHGRLHPRAVAVVDYDDLVVDKERLLPELYRFLGLDYRPEYARKIGAKSLQKKLRLRERQKRTISFLSEPVYRRAGALCTLK